ncbi:MAG: hypothetical protein ACK56F_29320, partial [bacterium]
EHYVYIKKMDVLVSKNRFDEDGKHTNKVAYPCPNCLHSFSTQWRLDKHRENGCDLFEPQKTFLPLPDEKKTINTEGEEKIEYESPIIEFKNHIHKFKSPVVIYADFETICQKIEHEHDYTKSSTTKFIKQKPCGYSFNVVIDYPQMNLGLQ